MTHARIYSPRHPAFTLVELLVVIAIIGVLIALLLPAVQAAREAARRMQCTNKLKQLGLAVQNYHDTHNALPTMCTRQIPNSPTQTEDAARNHLGWGYATQILPFMELSAIYDEYKGNFLGLRADNDGPTSRRIYAVSIPALRCPSDATEYTVGGGTDYAKIRDESPSKKYANAKPSNYLANGGDYSYRFQVATPEQSRGAMTYRGYTGLEAVTDGTSNTLLITERVIRKRNDMAHRSIRDSVAVDTTAVSVAAATTLDGFLDAVPSSCTPSVNIKGYTVNTATPPEGGPGTLWAMGFSINIIQTIKPPNGYSCAKGNDMGDAGIVTATSEHPGGVNGVYCDGSVHFISDTINCLSSGVLAADARPRYQGLSDFGVWGALGTRSGGESVSLP